MVRWLHEQGVALDVASNNGSQPMNSACQGGALEVVRWLHEQGVALDVACQVHGPSGLAVAAVLEDYACLLLLDAELAVLEKPADVAMDGAAPVTARGRALPAWGATRARVDGADADIARADQLLVTQMCELELYVRTDCLPPKG